MGWSSWMSCANSAELLVMMSITRPTSSSVTFQSLGRPHSYPRPLQVGAEVMDW